MRIGQAYQQWLTPREQQALATGSDFLIDCIFDDFMEIEEWEPESVAETALGSYLPSRYLSHYTPLFFKQFAVCVITVAWKLAQPQHMPLASVGEELAAWAILNQAKAALDMEIDREALLAVEETSRKEALERKREKDDEGATGDDFERFIENYFDDLDFLFLFDDQYDGIDASPAGVITGMASLSFHDWFRPFSAEPERMAHPYTVDG